MLNVSSLNFLVSWLIINWNWLKQTHSLLKSLAPIRPTLFRIRDKLNKNSRYLIYHSLVQSKINYCIELYGHASRQTLKPIKIMQNSILKILFNMNHRTPTMSLHSKLHVLSFDSLFCLRSMLLCHKSIHQNICYFMPNHQSIYSSSSRHPLNFKLFHSRLGNKDMVLKWITMWITIT